MAKDTYYFSHDCNARNDPKCSALIAEYGIEGYGLYWVMIEMLSEQDGYKIKKFPKLFEAIAKQCLSTAEATRSMVEALINCFNLLQEDENYIWSDSLLRRMQEKENRRQQKKEAGRKGGINSGLSRNQAKQNEAPLQINEALVEANEPKERKVKESKLNNREIYTPDFDKWYSTWPRPEAKRDSFKNFERVRKEKGLDYIWQTTSNYLQYRESIPKRERGPDYSSRNFYGQKAYHEDFIQPKLFVYRQSDNAQWAPGEKERLLDEINRAKKGMGLQ